VYQAHQHGKWNPRSSAYGRFWIDVADGERKRRTVSLGLCATQWVARLRLREYIERADLSCKHTFHQNSVPGTTLRQQAEWWMESVVKFVVASAVDEEGDQIHPRVWNYEFIQLPLVIKENQSRPTIHEAEIPGLLNSLKWRYAVLLALVAGTGLRIGEALAVRTEDFDSACQVLHIRRSVWHRREQAPKTPNAIRLVDIPEAMAQVLRRYTEGKDGYLFTTRAGRILDQSN
jgi:integrase